MISGWQRKILFWGFGLLTGAGAGFFLANVYLPPASSTQHTAKTEATLSLGEIKTAIANADAHPDDLPLQRKLGLGLYQYSRLSTDVPYLPEIARLLQRARKPGDREVTFALGNTLLALAQNGTREHLSEARQCYTQLLSEQPADADSRTALGLTYFYESPPQTASAIRELRQALITAPQHQGALQGLATMLLSQGQFKEADKAIKELAATNPQHPALDSLRRQLNAESQIQ